MNPEWFKLGSNCFTIHSNTLILPPECHHVWSSDSDLVGKELVYLVVHGGRVVHQYGHLGLVEHRLWDDSQHSTRTNQPQVEFSISPLQARTIDTVVSILS